MLRVNVHEAKTHLSRLLQQVESGEEVIISRANKPVARLSTHHGRSAPRVPGALRGQIWIAPDFDELPEEILDAFSGNKP